MFRSFVKLFARATKKVAQEVKKDETLEKVSEKIKGVFDVIDTPKVDEFNPENKQEPTLQPTLTPSETPVVTQAPVETLPPISTEAPIVTQALVETEPPVVDEPLYDEEGYDKDGYDVNGFDRDGYNKEGYNKEGFDKEGYNAQGYDAFGYNREGYNKDGYNAQGFNKEGYDKDGFDINGFDKNGYDKNGFDSTGYNKNGLDINGYNKEGWKIEEVVANDENGKIISKTTTKTKENVPKVVEILEYNQDGSIKSTTVENYSLEGKIQNSITNNSDGSQIQKNYEYTNKNVNYETVSSYDANGKLTSQSYNHLNSSNAVVFTTTTDYTYSSSGKLQSYKISKIQNGQTVYNIYDANNNRTGGNETLSTISGLKMKLVYNSLPLSSSMAKVVSSTYGEDTAGLLDLAGNKSTSYKNQITKTFANYKEVDINGKDYSGYLNYQMHQQFDKTYGFNLDNIPGYYFDSNSGVSKRMASDEKFVAYLKTNQEKLLNVTPENYMSYSFEKADNENMYYAFHGVEIIDSWIDEEGYTHVIVADTYDFNAGEGSLVQTGLRAMKEGKIDPYFTLNEVKVKL